VPNKWSTMPWRHIGGGGDVYIHILLTLTLAGGGWSASRPGRFTPAEGASSTHWIGGWVDPRAGLDDLEKRKFLTLQGLKLWPLSLPAIASCYTDYATPAPIYIHKGSQDDHMQLCIRIPGMENQ
jgi:hypothetical protein